MINIIGVCKHSKTFLSLLVTTKYYSITRPDLPIHHSFLPPTEFRQDNAKNFPKSRPSTEHNRINFGNLFSDISTCPLWQGASVLCARCTWRKHVSTTAACPATRAGRSSAVPPSGTSSPSVSLMGSARWIIRNESRAHLADMTDVSGNYRQNW